MTGSLCDVWRHVPQTVFLLRGGFNRLNQRPFIAKQSIKEKAQETQFPAGAWGGVPIVPIPIKKEFTMPNASTSFFGWVYFLLQKYGMLFLRGTGMTLLIALTGTALGFVLGLLVAIVRTITLPEKKRGESGVGLTIRRGLLAFVQLLTNIYIQVFRGTPMIVQAVVIYYGAQYAGIFMDTTFAAIFIISINTGAYMAEIIRGGIVSVDKGQFEAAHAIGMTHWQTMTTVILPQAIRNILPSVGNELIVNIKDSSVLNVISVSELFFQAKSAAGAYYRYFEVYFIIAVIYFILTLTVSRILRIIEKKMGRPGQLCDSRLAERQPRGYQGVRGE